MITTLMKLILSPFSLIFLQLERILSDKNQLNDKYNSLQNELTRSEAKVFFCAIVHFNITFLSNTVLPLLLP